MGRDCSCGASGSGVSGGEGKGVRLTTDSHSSAQSETGGIDREQCGEEGKPGSIRTEEKKPITQQERVQARSDRGARKKKGKPPLPKGGIIEKKGTRNRRRNERNNILSKGIAKNYRESCRLKKGECEGKRKGSELNQGGGGGWGGWVLLDGSYSRNEKRGILQIIRGKQPNEGLAPRRLQTAGRFCGEEKIFR